MVANSRRWLRTILGLPVAAALVTVPLWWEAAGTLVRASLLAPAWPWLVPALLGAMVVALTLPAPLPSRGRRLERRMDRFEGSFLRRLAATAGQPAPAEWRRELAERRNAATERLGGAAGRGQRRIRRAGDLLDERWQRIAAVLAERERGQAGQPAPGVSVADLVDAALREACGARAAAGEQASDAQQAASPAAMGPQRRAGEASARPAASPRPPADRAAAGRGTGSASAGGGAPVTVYEAGAFAKAVQQARESVALEGGVYRVRERLYGSRAEPRRSLRRMAEGVITDDKIARLETAGRRREVRTPVTADGLNYDQLVAQFPNPGASETRARVLEDQRVAMEADAALLLVSRTGGYTAKLACGAQLASGATLAYGSAASDLSTIVLTAGDALYDDYLRGRRYLLAGPGSGVSSSLPFAAERVALLPAIVDGGRAYLLFAAAAPRDAAPDPGEPWSRETLIERLNLHP